MKIGLQFAQSFSPLLLSNIIFADLLNPNFLVGQGEYVITLHIDIAKL
jgi:hypothetical protein